MKEKYRLNRFTAIICVLICFLIGLLSLFTTFKLMGPVGRLLLYKHYGKELVVENKLEIFQSKPDIQISNGDIIPELNIPYSLLVFFLVFTQVILYFVFTNLITKGWLHYILKNINKVSIKST